MSIDQHSPVEQPHQTVEQQSFRTAEQGATAALQSEFGKTSLADFKPVQNIQSASLGLPNVSLFDSTAGGGSVNKSIGEGGPSAVGFGAEGQNKPNPSDMFGVKNGPVGQAGGLDGVPSIGNDLTGRIVKAVGENEGDLTKITKNDAGHGISVGIRQWNQKAGELPDLLKSMHDKNPEKFDQTFGPYAKNLQNEKYVRHTDMAHNPDLMKRMDTALHDNEFQNVQVNQARNFAKQAIDTAQQYGLKTERGAAMVADIVNQTGPGGLQHALKRAGLHAGGSVQNEDAAIERLGQYHRPNSADRANTIASSFNNNDLINRPRQTDSSRYTA